ncbi:hypothetical protein ADL35_12400 [Streptomyces sp. NRRL WC-3753]|nr:hypothetical protein ADL35_12400 [Streptomyces sp. NRRL WC-3753]
MRGQWVKYPLRVVTDAEAYAPGDTNFYCKVKALSQGRPATAAMEKIAGYLGRSKSSGERAARRLGSPAPTDGVVELFTKRQTHKITGTGQTAERWCRVLERGEAFVMGPVLAAETLSGNEHRLYLGLRHSVLVRGHQPTLSELAELLRHHGGKRAGQPLAEASVARLLDRLEELGWISLERRAGYRGRHLITVHDDPVHPVDEPEAPTPDAASGGAASPDPGDGSGPDLGDGSLAYKEDLGLNDRRSTPRRGSFRRRRDDRKWVPAPVDTHGNQTAGESPAAPAVPSTLRGRVRPAARPAYAGPSFTLSQEAWTLLRPVLAPVSDLLPDVSPFMTRRIVREILRQIRDDGIWPDEIRDQVARLRRWTPAEALTDPGRWLLGAVLPVRSRCGMTGCHWGFLAHTGMPCKSCAELESTADPPDTGGPRPYACRACGWDSPTPLPYDRCAACRPA